MLRAVVGVLLVLVLLLATAHAQSGWVTVVTGMSCDFVCKNQTNAPCSVASMQRLSTPTAFEQVKDQLGITSPCLQYVTSGSTTTPGLSSGTYFGAVCELGGRQATCEASSANTQRLCCCTASSSGCRTSCPLSEWGEWTVCTHNCTQGAQTRTRTIPPDCSTRKTLWEARTCTPQGESACAQDSLNTFDAYNLVPIVSSTGQILPSDCLISTCNWAPSGQNSTTICPRGVYRSVPFASFGNPTGSCVDYNFQVSWCDMPVARVGIEYYCTGASVCSGYLTPENYGVDPCPQTPKWLAAISVCGYTDDSVPWISQGYDVPKPKIYTPLDRYGRVSFISSTTHSLMRACTSQFLNDCPLRSNSTDVAVCTHCLPVG
jgi:hypothetical protein